MRRSIDDQLLELVRSVDAERATVSMTFDKDSWWTRRGRGTERHYSIEIEWGDDHNDKRTFSGMGRSFADALTDIKAEVAGYLLKGALDA